MVLVVFTECGDEWKLGIVPDEVPRVFWMLPLSRIVRREFSVKDLVFLCAPFLLYWGCYAKLVVRLVLSYSQYGRPPFLFFLFFYFRSFMTRRLQQNISLLRMFGIIFKMPSVFDAELGLNLIRLQLLLLFGCLI